MSDIKLIARIVVLNLLIVTNCLASPSLWYVGGYEGYGKMDGMYQHDGETAQGRFVIGINAKKWRAMTVGLEGGLQSGNAARLMASPQVMNTLGGLPIQATFKPLLDLLLTLKCPLNDQFNAIFKGGIAYRQMQFDNRDSINDLRKMNAELQIGIGYFLTKQALLAAYYQGIYAGTNAGLTLTGPETAKAMRIPTQQTLFIGMEYSV